MGISFNDASKKFGKQKEKGQHKGDREGKDDIDDEQGFRREEIE